MKIIRDKLLEFGFKETKLKPDVSWSDLLYEWVTDEERYGSHHISITSGSNWHFKIERSFSGYETGVEGYGKYTCFTGVTSSLEEFNIILKTTGVLDIILKTPNVLK